MPAKPGFMKRIRELCDQHNALMVLDEIQSAWAAPAPCSRTGRTRSSRTS